MTKIIAPEFLIVEIVEPKSGAIVVCDMLSYLASCDEGIERRHDDIVGALNGGEEYSYDGLAGATFTIRHAPAAAYELI